MIVLTPGVAVGGGAGPASGVVPHLAVSRWDVDLLIPAACFVLVLVILVRELVRGSRLEEARDALASERRELLELAEQHPVVPDPPLWPQRGAVRDVSLRDELARLDEFGRAR